MDLTKGEKTLDLSDLQAVKLEKGEIRHFVSFGKNFNINQIYAIWSLHDI